MKAPMDMLKLLKTVIDAERDAPTEQCVGDFVEAMVTSLEPIRTAMVMHPLDQYAMELGTHWDVALCSIFTCLLGENDNPISYDAYCQMCKKLRLRDAERDVMLAVYKNGHLQAFQMQMDCVAHTRNYVDEEIYSAFIMGVMCFCLLETGCISHVQFGWLCRLMDKQTDQIPKDYPQFWSAMVQFKR